MDTLAPFRRYFKIAALTCSVASAILTFWFGLNQNPQWILAFAVALFLTSCSVASDYVVLFVVDAFRQRKWLTAGFCISGMAVVFTLNLMSNIGSVGWQRETVSTAAKVQNTRYEDVRDSVEESQTSLKLWEARLAKLEADNAWAASVTADGLRAQVADLRKAEAAETRLGGCGRKCRAIQNQIVDVQGKIAVAEQRGKFVEQIAATEAVLAKARTESKDTKTAVAAPASQAKFFASMATVSLEPSATAETWTDRGIASWIAIGLCLAPIFFGFLGWRTDTFPAGSVASSAPSVGDAVRQSQSEPVAAYPALVQAEPTHYHVTQQITEEALRRWAKGVVTSGQLRAA